MGPADYLLGNGDPVDKGAAHGVPLIEPLAQILTVPDILDHRLGVGLGRLAVRAKLPFPDHAIVG